MEIVSNDKIQVDRLSDNSFVVTSPALGRLSCKSVGAKSVEELVRIVLTEILPYTKPFSARTDVAAEAGKAAQKAWDKMVDGVN